MRIGFLQRLVIVALSSLLSLTASASEVRGGVTGNYLEIQVGTTRLKADDAVLPNSNGVYSLVKPSNDGVGVRLTWGYQFIDYVALEGAYTYYSPAIYNIQNGSSPELRIQSIDILGKGILPLYWGFSVFGKGGIAFVAYTEAGLLAPNDSPSGGGSGSHGITARPELAIGAQYAFTPNWMVDLSYNRVFKGSVVPTSTFAAVGLSYHAVDLYCGQFLC